MQQTIFYSWQSDLPNKTNRSFIGTALEQAAKALRDDDSIDVEPVVDRDTNNVPGSPEIAATIMEKISSANVFVADVSIISGPDATRPTPNPNVLIEVGYALRSLGLGRVILVMNEAFGKIEQLPFDLRGKRIVKYFSAEDAQERASDRRSLASELQSHIGVILSANDVPAVSPTKSLWSDAAESVRSNRPDADYQVKQYMSDVIERLAALSPDFSTGSVSEFYDRLVLALDATIDILVDFCRLCDIISAVNSVTAAKAIHKAFEGLFSRYDLPPRFAGSFKTIDFDYFKFLGYEMYVSFVATMLSHDRWEMIAEVLDEDLIPTTANGPKVVNYSYASQWNELIEYKNQWQNPKKISPIGDLINARHTSGELARVMPMDTFKDADALLFIRSWFGDVDRLAWRGESLVYLGYSLPRFVLAAERARFANRIAPALGCRSAEELKSKWLENPPEVRKAFREGRWIDEAPLDRFDPKILATR